MSKDIPVENLEHWIIAHTNGVDCKDSNDCEILLAQVIYKEIQDLKDLIENLKDK